MKYSIEEHNKLWDMMNLKLKPEVEDVVFLELNKDIFPGNKIKISKGVPLPIRPGDLVDGIKNNEYSETIDLSRIIDCMVYLIGCDKDFKHNQTYMNIIREIDSKMDSYLLSRAIKFESDGQLMDALIFFIAIDRIYDTHPEIKYNIADTLRKLAIDAENKHNVDAFELYYMLSFYEFFSMSREGYDYSSAHYYLGFYFLKEKQYEDAYREWVTALNTIDNEELKPEITQLLDSLRDNMNFEKGKDMIIHGSALDGLKLLVPILEKNKEWNELTFYTAQGYRRLNNYKKAEVLLLELLSSGEAFPEVFNELGICYFNMGMPDKAVEYFEKAASAIENEPSLLCNLGIAYYEIGDTVKSKEYINRAYSLNPDDELTMKCKVWADSI